MGSSRINSVSLGVDVLRCLAEGVNRVTDISTKLGISKSTVHRLLKTLESTGMVSQDVVDRTYRLGKLFVQFAYPLFSSHQRLIACASKEMQYLRKISGETTILYSKNGKELICVEELPSFHPIKYTFGKGNSMPWHVGAATKVVLAQLEDVEVERILDRVKYIAYTSNTNISKSRLREQIEEVKLKGYFVSIGTYESGAAALSVSIKNYVTPVALSILGSENVFGPKISEMIDKVLKSAENISNKLAEEF